MSRRQDREGVARHAYQAHVNAKLAAKYVEDDRGWKIPNTVEEAFDALNLSAWWLHYRALWFATGVLTPQSKYEIEEARHSARSYLKRAYSCPPAPLPL
jgi:hypothetical protein